MAVEIDLTRDRQIEELVREIGHVIDDAQPEHLESFRQMASDLLDTGNPSLQHNRSAGYPRRSVSAEHVALSV